MEDGGGENRGPGVGEGEGVAADELLGDVGVPDVVEVCEDAGAGRGLVWIFEGMV